MSQKKVVVIIDDYNIMATIEIRTTRVSRNRNRFIRTLGGTPWYNIVRKLQLSKGQKLVCHFERGTDIIYIRVVEALK